MGFIILFSLLLYMLLRNSIVKSILKRQQEEIKLNLVPGLPLVFLKGQGEDLNIPRGQVQKAGMVWDLLRTCWGLSGRWKE